MTSASTIPMSSTFCCAARGTANLAMMITNTKRLSTDRLYSVSQPATNSPAYRPPATAHSSRPNAPASPM